jgi:hypothetical protein
MESLLCDFHRNSYFITSNTICKELRRMRIPMESADFLRSYRQNGGLASGQATSWCNSSRSMPLFEPSFHLQINCMGPHSVHWPDRRCQIAGSRHCFLFCSSHQHTERWHQCLHLEAPDICRHAHLVVFKNCCICVYLPTYLSSVWPRPFLHMYPLIQPFIANLPTFCLSITS